MQTPGLVELRYGRVQFTDWGCEVHLHIGEPVPAMPHWNDPHYAVIAHRCGYQDDLLAYCREHEVAHLVVEEMLWGRTSPVLAGLATGYPVTPAQAAYEELVVQSIQRFARAGERPIVGGIDWDAIRSRFLEVLS